MASIINATTTAGVSVAGDNSGSLQLATNNGTTAVTIDTSQNVGIGTSSPSTKFQVNGAASTNNTSRFVAKFTDTSAVALGNGGGIMFQGVYTGTTALDCSGIQAYKENATDGNYSYAMTFATRANGGDLTERMRIDSSGNVGIGLTPPVGSGNYRILNVGATVVYGNTGLAVAAFNNNADINDKYVITGVASSYTQSSGNHLWYSAVSGSAGASISFTERMRITSGGKLLVGTATLFNNNDSGAIAWTSATGSGGEGGFEFQNTSTSTNSDANPALVIVKGSTTYTSAQRFIQFNANAGSQAMGGIVGNGATNVQFISLSDVREKENIEPISGSLNKVVALNPVEFDWKKTGEHISAGFVAQEVESLFPEYVVDNVANAGEEERKGLTGGMSAGFVAHLVKAIQELNAKVEAQAVRIAELEGAR